MVRALMCNRSIALICSGGICEKNHPGWIHIMVMVTIMVTIMIMVRVRVRVSVRVSVRALMSNGSIALICSGGTCGEKSPRYMYMYCR